MKLSSLVVRETSSGKRRFIVSLFFFVFLFTLPFFKSAEFFPIGTNTVYAAEQAAPAETPSAKEEGKSEAKKEVYPPAPKLTESDYPQVKGINGRIMAWLAAQLHLWFAAFVSFGAGG